MRPLTLILALAISGLAMAGQSAAQIRFPQLVKPFNTKAPQAPAPAAATTAGEVAAGPADWRSADPENTLVVDTSQGRIIVEMMPQMAPVHVTRIKTLTRRGFYNGRTFFRVVEDFMAQTGDPKDDGTGDSELPNMQPEFSFTRGRDTPFGFVGPANAAAPVGFVGVVPVKTQPDAMMALMANGRVSAQGLFCPGVAGMARAEAPDSGNSQFFLMWASVPTLNGAYTPFGRVLIGLDVIRKLKTGEPVPPPQDRMNRVRMLADLPTDERLDVQVMRTDGPAFRAYAERQRFEKGAAFDICDLEIQAVTR